MGNICRSPMAQTVAQKMACDSGLSRRLSFDSAGTHAHHVGSQPDPRAQSALLARGYALGGIRSRRIEPRDFQKFDLILAMDEDNFFELRRICPAEHSGKLSHFLSFAPALNLTNVPDPYYGNAQGFEHVLDLCEAGARGLIEHFSSAES